MNSTVMSFVCAALVSSVPLASRAAEVTVDYIQLEPWAMENPDASSPDKLVGILPDLMKEFSKRSGLSVKPQLTPYARVEKDLQDGACDFSILIWSDSRAGFAAKGTGVFDVESGVRAATGVPLKSYDDLKGLTISVTRALKLDARFDADAALKKDLDLDYTTGIRKVAGGRVQAVAGALGPVNYIIKKLGVTDKFADTLVLAKAKMYVHYSKKTTHPELETKVNEVLAGMVQDGTAKRLMDHWMSP